MQRPFVKLHLLLILFFIPASAAKADDGRASSPTESASLVAFGGSVLVVGDRAFVGRTGISTRYPEPVWQMAGVHVYRRIANSWTETAEISASDGTLGDRFGHALAASGDMLAVAAPLKNQTAGGVYVYQYSPDGWREIGNLDSVEAAPGDSLGWAVQFSGSTLVVGAPGTGMDAGAVYALQRDNTGSWIITGSITGARPGDGLGQAIACDHGACFVGAPGANEGRGKVVGFRVSSSGSLELRGEATSYSDRHKAFGYSLAAEDGRIVVGAPAGDSGAYVFHVGEDGHYSEPTIVQRPSDFEYSSLQLDFAFAAHVELNGSEIWVGARGADGAGLAFVYQRSAEGTMSDPQALSIYNLSLGGGFGGPLSVDGSTALVGVTRLDFGGGRAYFLERDEDGRWLESQNFVSPDVGVAAITGSKVECEEGAADVFGCSNVELLSFLPLTEIGGSPGITAADIWGWTDPETGREYVLANRMDGTAFIDVTEPVNPVYLGNLAKTATSVPNVHRDVKTYKHYALIVADNVGAHGMQVFDLTRLRTVENPPVEFEADAIYRGVESAHNVIVNEPAHFAYIVGADGKNSCGGALHMVDMSDPLNPVFAGCFNHLNTARNNQGATHDAQCVIYNGPDERYTGREICFSSNGTHLSIADVSDKANPVPISAASYPNFNYAHQGWLTDDHRYFYQDDESDEMNTDFGGTRTMIWDLQELDDPILAGVYISENQASDHNLYIRGNLMYQSNYVAGLRILDISDPENPVEVGYFDTMPWGKDEPGYAGSWSNYPYFKSGTIAVSSIREGVFLVRKADEVVP